MEWKVTSNPPELASLTMEALIYRGLTWEEFLDETLDQLEPLSQFTLDELEWDTPYTGTVSGLIALLTLSYGETLELPHPDTPEKQPRFLGFFQKKLEDFLFLGRKKKSQPQVAFQTEFLATGDTRNPVPTILRGEEFGTWEIPLSWVLLYCKTNHSLTLCLGKTSFDT